MYKLHYDNFLINEHDDDERYRLALSVSTANDLSWLALRRQLSRPPCQENAVAGQLFIALATFLLNKLL